MKALGKKIRLLRHQKGWSQEDVAKKLDISIPAFSKISICPAWNKLRSCLI
jgi:transcriptional regulator with XRE-family HTH domain